MPEVVNYTSSFRSINKRWDGAITAGMIETGRMDDEASRLFAPLIQDMGSTKNRYSEIQNRLVEAIMLEMAKKVILEVKDAAKFAIQHPQAESFRTYGRRGLSGHGCGNHQASATGSGKRTTRRFWPKRGQRIRRRLAEYQFEYTVYDEILVLDTEGYVRANLCPDNTLRISRDPCLKLAQDINLHSTQDADKFVEILRETDLHPRPGKTLVYAQKIEDPETLRSLGTLCLCFNFTQEVEGIFKDLRLGNERMTLAFLDADGSVLCSNNEELLPAGCKGRHGCGS